MQNAAMKRAGKREEMVRDLFNADAKGIEGRLCKRVTHAHAHT